MNRRPGRRSAQLAFRSSLVATDLLAFVAGFYAANAIQTWRALSDPFTRVLPTGAYAPLIGVQAATLTGVFFLMHLYHQKRGASRVDTLRELIKAVSLGIVLTFACSSFFLPGLYYSRFVPVYDWLATLALVVLGRLAHRTLWGELRRRGIGRERVLIVGAGRVGELMWARMRRLPSLGYELVGFVDDRKPSGQVAGVPVLGSTSQLGELVDHYGVGEVIIAMPQAPRQRIVGLVGQCHRDGVSIRVFPDLFQIMASEVEVGDLNGLPLLTMRDVALRGWRLTLKRAVDIVISACVLVLCAPLMLIIAALIRLDSPGRVFYLQERVGLDGRPFVMLKFRSMRVDAERGGAGWTSARDPRRTRVGRVLRRLSLDELPQFINVLLGHMSIVGPRPERPQFVDQFRARIPRYMERHRERAGITGWAQVNGLRGDTSIEDRTRYDLYYVENWSLWFDLKIMAKTLIQTLRDPNAY
jgi:exopolysaccharide biosynthesis polyprenyl glycosylphosphotransferase